MATLAENYLCKEHGLDPCPVCDGCGIEGHQPGVTVCLDCPSTVVDFETTGLPPGAVIKGTITGRIRRTNP